MEEKNRFGIGEIYLITDILSYLPKNGKIYCECCACMSVYSDFLSWIAAEGNAPYMTSDPAAASAIIILGCQVTDLAIYNDISRAEELHNTYPEKLFYMGGCLAKRYDIELPQWLKRLDIVRSEYQCIGNDDTEFTQIKTKMIWQKPFWVKNWKDTDPELTEGHLFRDMYPLKIGAGCHGKCKYCTIRDTRGKTYLTVAEKQEAEFLAHKNVVLISDSPSVQQIKAWCGIATRHNKEISVRNVEPNVAMSCKEELSELSQKGLLRIFHSPIQSNAPRLLKAMSRDVQTTLKYIDFAQELRKTGTIVGTNLIIDYNVDGEIIHNYDEDWLAAHFDYWAWNPYFDGKWDRLKAQARLHKYLKI